MTMTATLILKASAHAKAEGETFSAIVLRPMNSIRFGREVESCEWAKPVTMALVLETPLVNIIKQLQPDAKKDVPLKKNGANATSCLKTN